MREALNRLESGDKLTKQDNGFNEIVDYIIDDLYKDKPTSLVHLDRQSELRNLKKSDVISLQFSGMRRSYSAYQVNPMNNRIEVRYDSKKIGVGECKIYYYKVEGQLENLRLSALFWYAMFFYILGASIQLVSIIIKIKTPNP